MWFVFPLRQNTFRGKGGTHQCRRLHGALVLRL
jgi:hypothetical protein